MSVGSAPSKWVSRTEKCFTFFHADIEAGRLPLRRLPATLKDSMSTKAPIALETVPTRLELNSELWHKGGAGGQHSQHTSVGKRATSSARGSGWVSAHMDVMELSQLSDSEQFELAIFGPHSTPYLQAHGSDFEQFWPLPAQFGPPAPSQNSPHAAH